MPQAVTFTIRAPQSLRVLLRMQAGMCSKVVCFVLFFAHSHLSGYRPVEYTSPEVLASPEGADPNLRKEAAVCSFNCLDQNMKVDRRSFEGKYKVISGIPRNPVHRTGITGRGILGRWGPNHIADVIITRFYRDSAGEIVYRCGRPIIEYLCQELPNGTV
jgi:transient receptor potential cation channel subfamily M protein 2